jgi:predicted secreted hydrolase
MSEWRKELAIPRDAAPHPESNLEWWYCYAILSGKGGSRYALMTAFFRVGELPVGKGHYLIYSLIRLDKPQFIARSYLDRPLFYQMTGMYLPMYFLFRPGDRYTMNQYGQLLQGKLPSPHQWMKDVSVTSRPTVVRYGQAKLAFEDDAKADFSLRIDDPEGTIELEFAPDKPHSLIDGEGTLNGLYYYSCTRYRVSGCVRHSEGDEPLTGSGWFDHQWGRNYDLLKGEGWNWFGLQLDDGRELLASEFHKPNIPHRPGSPHPSRGSDGDRPAQAILILNDRAYTTKNVDIKPLRSWRSLRTGLIYPVEWRIRAPDLRLDLRVSAAFPQQEMPIIGPLRAIWEGACRVSGTDLTSGRAVCGSGFVELAGYAAVQAGKEAFSPV